VEFQPALEWLLKWGWPAIVTVMLIVLWRQYLMLDEKYHECLGEKQRKNDEGGTKGGET